MLERLQKIISRAGISSRRHAEQLILSGQVRVNGKVVTELGTKADPSKDKIEAAGRAIDSDERHVYLLLHKPPEVVSTLADPEGRKTLRNFLRGFPQRVYPVGNLEYAAAGLVFMTNDGDLALPNQHRSVLQYRSIPDYDSRAADQSVFIPRHLPRQDASLSHRLLGVRLPRSQNKER